MFAGVEESCLLKWRSYSCLPKLNQLFRFTQTGEVIPVGQNLEELFMCVQTGGGICVSPT